VRQTAKWMNVLHTAATYSCYKTCHYKLRHAVSSHTSSHKNNLQTSENVLSTIFHFRHKGKTQKTQAEEHTTELMSNWRHGQENIRPSLHCKCALSRPLLCLYLHKMTVVHNFQDELVKRLKFLKWHFHTGGRLRVRVCGGGGRCVLKRSKSHSFCLVTKFGYTPVDTTTLRLTGIGLQKIPHYPQSAIMWS
jgi:hypothetical protein